ncbi:MAG: B12-binding domain-containing radical SAM protein [Chloroflexi bacterium]|nr:B12-binding domain-containing radical SAM protein [Chloroflexota bacterium]MBU1746839.1 B12-binding domain-containing radical SAM protein [Chloroflexota bacterium]MBU1879887.1 B12-binding domain-containing radical SAM protein [Chloroflexota bacterium]
MRVLLVNPKSKLPIDVRTQPSLGLAYIGAVSRQRGDEPRVYDGDIETVSLVDVVREWQPHVVGITANTTQVKAAWRAAAEVKSVDADIPVVLGGPHPSVLPEESAARPEVDIVVRGEGEETWAELCAVLEQHADLGSVLGITFQTPAGSVIHNPDRPPIKDLDTLPLPDYSLFRMAEYTNLQPTLDTVEGARSFSIMTSRGCPYRCAYCSQSIYPARYRVRSPEHVVAEWRHLVRDLGAQEIGVLDDSFNIQRKRVHAICDLLIAEGLNHVPWIMINGIRANLADKDLLAHMKAAGCKRTAFGVESGNQAILDSIDKHLTLDQIRAAFRAAKEVDLETIGFFIIGLPGETEETMEQTIRFAIELDPVVANFSMLTPFPGTRVYQQIQEGGGRLLVDDWEDYAFFESTARYEMGATTAELQTRKWHEAYRRFYMRPSRILRTLTRWQTWRDLPRVARMALRLVLPG